MNLHQNWLVGNSKKQSKQRRKSSPPCQLPGLSVSVWLGVQPVGWITEQPPKVKGKLFEIAADSWAKNKTYVKIFHTTFQVCAGKKVPFVIFCVASSYCHISHVQWCWGKGKNLKLQLAFQDHRRFWFYTLGKYPVNSGLKHPTALESSFTPTERLFPILKTVSGFGGSLCSFLGVGKRPGEWGISPLFSCRFRPCPCTCSWRSLGVSSLDESDASWCPPDPPWSCSWNLHLGQLSCSLDPACFRLFLVLGVPFCGAPVWSNFLSPSKRQADQPPFSSLPGRNDWISPEQRMSAEKFGRFLWTSFSGDVSLCGQTRPPSPSTVISSALDIYPSFQEALPFSSRSWRAQHTHISALCLSPFFLGSSSWHQQAYISHSCLVVWFGLSLHFNFWVSSLRLFIAKWWAETSKFCSWFIKKTFWS